MKKAIVFVMIVSCLFKCKPTEGVSPKQVRIGQVFGLKHKDKTNLQIDNKQVSMELLEITEDRCIGKNIVCIWSGILTIDLKITDNQVVSLGVLDWKTDEKVSQSASNPKEIRISNTEKLIVYVERIEIKDPNQEWIGATPKENYTVWLKIIKA